MALENRVLNKFNQKYPQFLEHIQQSHNDSVSEFEEYCNIFIKNIINCENSMLKKIQHYLEKSINTHSFTQVFSRIEKAAMNESIITEEMQNKLCLKTKILTRYSCKYDGRKELIDLLTMFRDALCVRYICICDYISFIANKMDILKRQVFKYEFARMSKQSGTAIDIIINEIMMEYIDLNKEMTQYNNHLNKLNYYGNIDSMQYHISKGLHNA